MKTYVHNFTSQQVHLNDFDSTNDFSIDNTLNTTTQGNNLILNPLYSCKPRRGYSLTSDILNPWKRQEQPEDYGRKEIAKAYRLPIVGF